MNTNTGISQSITATGIGSQLRPLDSVLQSASNIISLSLKEKY